MDDMIELKHVTKAYGRRRAVEDVSFRCEQGTVTGFLGPNGAGKSTTLRILAGLCEPTSGTALIEGRRYADIPNPGRRIGLLLDASAQHAGRTGRDVLLMSAMHLGLPRTRVDEVLEIVSLTTDEAKRRIGHYSLGMRQRLGLAHALLGDPTILVLDEPANGLDPAGIHWMRGLLRDFAGRGGTVLLSSHLLAEVEVVADRFVLIGNGRIVADGTKADLLGSHGTFVRAMPADALATALDAAGLSWSSHHDGVIVEAEPAVVADAVVPRIRLEELRRVQRSGLEDLFLELTADSQRETTSAAEGRAA